MTESKATTPEGIIFGLNQKFSREAKSEPNKTYTAIELSYLFQDRVQVMERINKQDKEIRKKLRVADSEGWKSKDELVFERIGETWIITEHRKDKKSDEIGTIVHKIPEENVIKLWDLIKKLCPSIGTSTTYRKIALSLIETYHLPLDIEEFNGGRNRSASYFPYYYYPTKILEYLGEINYGGRGKITRLQK